MSRDRNAQIYINHGHCPACGSFFQFETESFGRDRDYETRMQCDECGAEWTNYYKVNTVLYNDETYYVYEDN